MRLNYKTLTLLSRFPISLTLVVIWTRVRKDGWVLCGAGCHSRLNGIGSESWSRDLNQLSYSNIALLKLKTCENIGDFPGDWQLYLQKCFDCKVSSLKNVAPLKAHTASSLTANTLDPFYRSVTIFFVDVDTLSVVHWKILKINSITFNNFNTTPRSFLAVTRSNQCSSMVNL